MIDVRQQLRIMASGFSYISFECFDIHPLENTPEAEDAFSHSLWIVISKRVFRQIARDPELHTLYCRHHRLIDCQQNEAPDLTVGLNWDEFIGDHAQILFEIQS
jgi:hypothetical protein